MRPQFETVELPRIFGAIWNPREPAWNTILRTGTFRPPTGTGTNPWNQEEQLEPTEPELEPEPEPGTGT